MPKTALITGGTGLLGREVVKAFKRAGWMAIGTGLTRANPPDILMLDLLQEEDIEKVLSDAKPDVVVHCAANRFPDQCTKDPTQARSLNATSTSHLAAHCHAKNVLLIYISTDYVFSGAPGEAPYRPSSPPSPTNVYGQTKREGEETVLQQAPYAGGKGLAVVLRVPILYGHIGDEDPSAGAVNVLVKQIWKSQYGQKIKMDHYAQRYPTATEDVARICVDVSKLYLEKQRVDQAEHLPRILHFSAEERMTKWEMCEVLAEILGLPLGGVEAWDPSRDDVEKSERGEEVTVRPYDCHLDTGVLKELEVDVTAMSFKDWWKRELLGNKR
ncbi:hypothetical protein LTS18_008813 [Coniosporium uncinatum]|uniref:Uncharacterized protein n=1 Tax=Coniosporium uncinatum TaxID=93489 RepID=A0ACC3D142_9PEZI|nr:hypothetical protein LTS18_008813 [Coniosporium uncinatum]